MPFNQPAPELGNQYADDRVLRSHLARALPAEVLATAVHSGDPNAGEAFISAWRQLVSALEGAADTVRSVGGQLPEQWDSPVSTDAVRDHLYRYAQALDTSASRAQTLAWQAGRHGEQNAQARNDIPPPQQFAALRQQIHTVSAANIASGGKYAAQLELRAAGLTDRVPSRGRGETE